MNKPTATQDCGATVPARGMQLAGLTEVFMVFWC